jgi:hypothetical protein
MNEKENSAITAVIDSAKLMDETFPNIIDVSSYSFNIFNKLLGRHSEIDPQRKEVINILKYHIEKDILEYAKSCFSEKKLKR